MYKKGHKHSDEVKKKIGMANTGKVFSDERRRKISEAKKRNPVFPIMCGEENPMYGKIKDLNPNWKGGITKLQHTIRTCFKYRQWRSDVLTNDNFTCVLCGLKGRDVDHFPKKFFVILQENKIKSYSDAVKCEELWNINNGRTLCWDCHNKTKKKI